MEVIITIDDPVMDGRAFITVSPDLNTLEKAAQVDTPMTPAQVYALAALNFLRVLSKDPGAFTLPAVRGKARRITLPFTSVDKVTIRLTDRADGGVAAVSDPSFNVLASMVAGGSKISTVHKYALAAISRIYEVSRDSKRRDG